tara:strand:+ start:2597 stop:3106 length:510 start_codon:yes stop_codon:yes gene_type:complete
MGKPTNTKSKGCVTTTSNCVVWQGPDLCCIDLCTGDTVSEVIAALAEKICTLFDLLNVNHYDVSCLVNEDCPPNNFVELLQKLIEEVCALKGSNSESGPATSDLPNMTTASCFQSQYGTVLSLVDYVTAIGVKLCEQELLITTQNNAIAQLQSKQTQMQSQIDLLIQGS